MNDLLPNGLEFAQKIAIAHIGDKHSPSFYGKGATFGDNPIQAHWLMTPLLRAADTGSSTARRTTDWTDTEQTVRVDLSATACTELIPVILNVFGFLLSDRMMG
ncbi:MAG: hypothetical protein ACTS2F_05285 [Thainema sp.]